MANGTQRVVRVAIVGDAGVGKTSLISTAATEAFDARPPSQLPPTRLPASFSPENVPLQVTDTSSRPEDAAATDRAMELADVVVMCFEARRPATLDSIRTHWYPRLQQLNSEAPVVVACCKSDRVPEDAVEELQGLRERVERNVSALPSVDVCLNCSARSLRMVADVFGFALKSVIFPMQPLYDRVERRLRPLAVKAFKRVFIMCDTDKDSHLDNAELNEFQQACFGISLTDDELDDIKHVVRQHYARGVDPERGLTLEGFLHLHVLFIERNCMESPWAVLRNYGYTDDLHIKDEVLDQVPFNLPQDQVYELSDVALRFLAETFSWYDDDQDGHISHEQLQAMFSTAPQPLWQGERWSRLLTPGTLGSVLSLEAFLLKWQYATLSDARAALTALLYLGWGSPSGAQPSPLLVRCARRTARWHDKRHDLAQRSTLHCYVFGSRGSGKTALLKALAGRQPNEQSPGWATGGALTAVGLVQDRPGEASNGSAFNGSGTGASGTTSAQAGTSYSPERTLILSEISEETVNEWMAAAALAATSHTPDPLGGLGARLMSGRFLGAAVPGPGVGALPDLARCDVAAFVFDSSREDSFKQAHDMLIAVSTAAGSSLPCVMIAAKDDLGMAQKLEMEVKRACTDLAIRPPVPIATEAGQLSSVFRILAWAAAHPGADGLVPDTPARKAYKRFLRQLYITGAATLSVAAVASVLWWLARDSSRRPVPPAPPAAPSPALPPTHPSASDPTWAAPQPTSTSYRVSTSSLSGAEGGYSALHQAVGRATGPISSATRPADIVSAAVPDGGAVLSKAAALSSDVLAGPSWGVSSDDWMRRLWSSMADMQAASLAPMWWCLDWVSRDLLGTWLDPKSPFFGSGSGGGGAGAGQSQASDAGTQQR